MLKQRGSNYHKTQALFLYIQTTRHPRYAHKTMSPIDLKYTGPIFEIFNFFNSIGLQLYYDRFYSKDIKLRRGLSTRVLLKLIEFPACNYITKRPLYLPV